MKREKERKIDATLYEAVLYLSCLHKNGASQYEAVESLARNAEYFGDAAFEFCQILADTDSGYSISESMMRLSETTHSKKLRQFLSGYLTAIQTTGSAVSYLDDTLCSLREERRFRQKTYLESLSILGEIFLVLFVAGPLFVMIAAMVLGMISGVDVTIVAFCMFAALPLGTAAFLILLDSLDESISLPFREIEAGMRKVPSRRDETEGEAALFQALKTALRREKRKAFCRNPTRAFSESPLLVFCITVPAALLSLLLFQTPGMKEVFSLIPSPVSTSVFPPSFYLQIAIIFLILFVPFAVFSELKEKRRRAAESVMPGFLRSLGDSMSRGVSLSDAVHTAAEADTSSIRDELYRVSSDISIGSNPASAFSGFANRMKLPYLTRIVVSLRETTRFAGAMAETLRILSAEANQQVMREEERHASMSAYVAVIYLGFGVFLFVISIMLTVFLDAMALTSDVSALGISAFPVSAYQEIGVLSVLVHGLCSGISAGKMGNGSVVSGVKHACILVAVGAAAMVLIGMV